MDFSTRLAAARKHARLTPQALTEHVGTHLSQRRRSAAGVNQSSLDVLGAIALSITTDGLASP